MQHRVISSETTRQDDSWDSWRSATWRVKKKTVLRCWTILCQTLWNGLSFQESKRDAVRPLLHLLLAKVVTWISRYDCVETTKLSEEKEMQDKFLGLPQVIKYVSWQLVFPKFGILRFNFCVSTGSFFFRCIHFLQHVWIYLVLLLLKNHAYTYLVVVAGGGGLRCDQ